jgi:hypothetical protein
MRASSALLPRCFIFAQELRARPNRSVTYARASSSELCRARRDAAHAELVFGPETTDRESRCERLSPVHIHLRPVPSRKPLPNQCGTEGNLVDLPAALRTQLCPPSLDVSHLSVDDVEPSTKTSVQRFPELRSIPVQITVSPSMPDAVYVLTERPLNPQYRYTRRWKSYPKTSSCVTSPRGVLQSRWLSTKEPPEIHCLVASHATRPPVIGVVSSPS